MIFSIFQNFTDVQNIFQACIPKPVKL